MIPGAARRSRILLRPMAIVVAGALVALAFCFMVYPRIDQSYGAGLDPDGYGRLGIQVWSGRGLSDDSGEPTVYRGPLYPGLIALALWISRGAYPWAIWVVQSMLHGLTCLLVSSMAGRCWGRSVGLFSGFGCAFYPVLFWYTPRMWNEVLLALLVTALVYLSVRLAENAAWAVALGAGIVLGLLCLTKGTFLPWILVLPLSLWLLPSRRSVAPVVLVPLTAVLLIAPWTVRNYLFTRRFIPVHTGIAFNLKVGNALSRDLLSDPLSYDRLWQRDIGSVLALTDGLSLPGAAREVEKEEIYWTSALNDVRADPWLILRKIIVAGTMFWYLGDTPLKTGILLILRLPVLVLAVAGIVRSLRGGERRLWPALALLLTYWLAHLPFAPPARLSMPILPVLFAFAMSVLAGGGGWEQRKRMPIPESWGASTASSTSPGTAWARWRSRARWSAIPRSPKQPWWGARTT